MTWRFRNLQVRTRLSFLVILAISRDGIAFITGFCLVIEVDGEESLGNASGSQREKGFSLISEDRFDGNFQGHELRWGVV